MNSFLEKLGSYHIFTNLIPGTFFSLSFYYLFGTPISTGTIGEDVVIYYFIGFLISRIGSLIVTPVLKMKWGKKKRAFIVYADYIDYIEAAKLDTKIDTLSETNDGFRNLLTCSISLPFIEIIRIIFIEQAYLCVNWRWAIIPFLIVIFLFAYREQTGHIRKRVKIINEINAKKENSTKNNM